MYPADFAWSEAVGGAAAPIAPEPWPQASADAVAQAAAALKSGDNACLFIGGKAQRAEGLALAHRISAATGARVIAEVFPARIQRGRGRLAPERLPYFGEMAADYLKDFAHIVLIGAQAPVSWVQLAGRAMGVAASAQDPEGQARSPSFRHNSRRLWPLPGPRLIEVML